MSSSKRRISRPSRCNRRIACRRYDEMILRRTLKRGSFAISSFKYSRPCTRCSHESAVLESVLTSQFLRSVSLGINLTRDSTLTLAVRNINGYGGFATNVGNNLALAYHEHFRSGDELYVNYGSPAAGATLDRLIVKFIFDAGADAGT
jgi:hypothetical protein